MLTNSEKISLVINRINNLDAMIKSFIEYSDICKNKYSLEEVLLDCNAQKQALLEKLQELGGVWTNWP